MLTQHEVCLDVSVDTTLGYGLPASRGLATLLLRRSDGVQPTMILAELTSYFLVLPVRADKLRLLSSYEKTMTCRSQSKPLRPQPLHRNDRLASLRVMCCKEGLSLCAQTPPTRQ